MSNEHVSTWTASVYTIHATMYPRGSACVYIVHVLDRGHQNDLPMTNDGQIDYRRYEFKKTFLELH